MKTLKLAIVSLLAIPLFLLFTVAALGGSASAVSKQTSGVDLNKITPLARQTLSIIDATRAEHCPELPTVWVVAQVQAESAWNPRAWADDRNGGTAGLLQINQANWTSLRGEHWGVPAHARPPVDHGVWNADEHLTRGVRLDCRNLAQATEILATANEHALTPVEGMLVCHNAGCGALASGNIPDSTRTYINRITRYATEYAAPTGGSGGGQNPLPVPPGECGVDQLTPRPNPRDCAEAVAWAIDQTGDTCQWYQRCLGFTAHAFGWDASGVNSAAENWQLMLDTGVAHPDDPNPPVGALVHWAGGDYGHVALYIGNGLIASNDVRRDGCIDTVPLETISDEWGFEYLGWAPPYFPNGVGRDSTIATISG